MKELTPQETFQAIADDKALEYKRCDSDKWERFNVLENSVFIITVLNGRFVFRLAQEMVTIGEVNFPKPVSEPLAPGTEYWTVQPSYSVYTTLYPSHWSDDLCDKMFLERGFIHLSKGNAVAHTRALIKLSGGITND